MTNPLVGPSALRDIVNPQFHQNNFPEELYIKNELGIRLDKGNDTLYLSTLCTLLNFPSHR
jgi:cleavage and polyadenylation specificity factor subunit 4